MKKSGFKITKKVISRIVFYYLLLVYVMKNSVLTNM